MGLAVIVSKLARPKHGDVKTHLNSPKDETTNIPFLPQKGSGSTV